MKPTLEEYITATGRTVEEARQWQTVIGTIAAKTGEPARAVASIIMRPLASGKVVPSDCRQLQELGVPLSESFMKLTPSGEATDKELLHELTRLGYNNERGAENRG